MAYQKIGSAITDYIKVTAPPTVVSGKYQHDKTGLSGQYYTFIVANNTSGSGVRSDRIRVESTWNLLLNLLKKILKVLLE